MAANMPARIFALTILALLTLELVPQHFVARFRVIDVRPRSRRGLLDGYPDETSSSSLTKALLTAELIPYNHVKSPFYQPDLTRAERLAISAQRSRARRMRIDRQLEDVTLSGPFTSPDVYYNEGEWVIGFTIGTPARTYLVIAGTAADLCWVQCKGCDPCFKQPDQLFNPAASSTYKKVPCSNSYCANASSDTGSTCDSSNSCQYEYSYGDGSGTNGTLSQETVTLYNSSGQASTFGHFYFGCGFHDIADFGQIDGLVGLGQGPLSLVSQLGSAIGHKFSYCLVDVAVANLTTTLVFGSEGSLQLNYTTLVANPSAWLTYYFVDIQSITVGGYSLPYDHSAFAIDEFGNGGLILDIGTTLTFMTEAVYPLLLKQLRKQIPYTEINAKPYSLDLCYNTSNVGSVDFPEVAFTLGHLVLTPNPNENIFGIVDPDDYSVYCLLFTSTPNGTTSILGSNWQQNYQIGYDLAERKVGFAPTDCANPSK